MIERPIPEDITKHKSKAIGNFSARELCFGTIGCVVILVNMFTVLTAIEDISTRAIVSALPAVPFFLVGFKKIYGVYFEKAIGPMITDNFINPITRKKEVHYKDIEDLEKTRPWVKPANVGKKIPIAKSRNYKGIK